LAAVDLRLALLERQLEKLAPELVPDVVRIHETITSVNDGLRHLLFELEPVGASAHLTDLLEDAAAHIFELSPVDWTMGNKPDPGELELSITTRTQAVRIAKEALVNVAKHARATTVRILVTLDEDGVTVGVADDGVGIPPGVRSSPPGHRGISGMLDRAEIAGGSFSMDTQGTGTTISVWLPRV
jgi:signal transduction histidine kinase